MSFAASDFQRYHPEAVTNLPGNGGRMSRTPVSTAKHGLFPRVTRSQRDAGDVILRKLFLANAHPDNEVAADVLAYLEAPSRGGDHFLLARGTMRNVQADLELSQPDWLGVGRLNASLSGGELSLDVLMESSDAVFLNGGLVHIASTYKTGQSAAQGVKPGDSVQYDDAADIWNIIPREDDIAFPKGVWLGGGLVLTDDDGGEEWLRLAENLHEGETIGSGDGVENAPPLAALSFAASGVCGQQDKLPVVTAVCGGVERMVTIQPDGSCAGYCAAGSLNMADGSWTEPIAWTTAPDQGLDIRITYREDCFAYAGNVATLTLAEQVAEAHDAASTYCAGVVEGGDLEPSIDSFSDFGTQSGEFDDVAHPIELTALGCEEEDWSLAFTSATAFIVSGARIGAVGVGSVAEDFAPLNPVTASPYFTIRAAAWSGVWASGDTITFTTHPAALPLWFKEVVPPGTEEEPYNLLTWGYWVD
ncbi:hypothetical protein [Oceanidesulfovibrio marinus]|uniref:Uncharacterized protein n=1 Tax=Oceanidesulfovibrio marinus TaxID=370038 RepID=A0A6P1ZDP5_9BACT|nr:hypothetical protein [Oceanidesulfovibrio marinus]TVM31757.1 hypothetical protein DQK91_17645 [Oceanidesulfovibrio marinus]